MPNNHLTILIVDDDPDTLELNHALLESRGFQVFSFASAVEAIESFHRQPTKVALVDWELGELDGGQLARQLLARDPFVQVIIFTAFGTRERIQEAQDIGVLDFVSKPIDNDELVLKVKKAAKRYDELVEKQRIQDEKERVLEDSLVGQNPHFVQILNDIFYLAASDDPILLLGETGTGKELVAQAIHRRSPRKGRFVVVNCPALTDTILESALFGHERGAFTGAITQKKGYFEDADGGTIFLDEIGDLSDKVQAALLRVLQSGEITRVGGTRLIRVNVRVIAATNRNLTEKVEQGSFRSDLFFRLNTFSFTLPPLRERKDDIELLARYFVRTLGETPVEISKEAMEKLKAYNYPGNVRELRNVVNKALKLSKGTTIMPTHITFQELQLPNNSYDKLLSKPWKEAKYKFEEIYLRNLHQECHGNVGKMSKRSGIDTSDLYKKLKAYGIK